MKFFEKFLEQFALKHTSNKDILTVNSHNSGNPILFHYYE